MIVQYLLIISVSTILTVHGTSEPGCPIIPQPAWGEVSCTLDNKLGSVCTLSCEEHYDLAGTTDDSIDVTCQSDAQWSAPTGFTCTPIRCVPPLETPLNGDLICSATNLAQSLCVFFCKSHYDLVGVDTDRNAYAICRDDGDGDEFGEWSAVNSEVVFPPSLNPTCEQIKCDPKMQAPENGQVICSAEEYSGSTCVFYCNAGYKFKGKKDPVLFSSCRDDGDYDNMGKWTMQKVPTCQKCKRVKDLSIMALIRDFENDPKQYNLAAKMISRIITVLKRKQRLNPTVRVNRYCTVVNGSTEVYTTDFQARRDKQRIEAIPFSGESMVGADIDVALTEISDKLIGDGTVFAAFIFTNDMMGYDDESHKLAEELRARGVDIFVFTLPQKSKALTWKMEDLVKLAGSGDKVFSVMGTKDVETHKNNVAEQIDEATLKMGCDKKKKM